MVLVESWKQELDRKYAWLTSQGDSRLIDEANEVILTAVARLNRIIKRHKNKVKRR